MAQFYLKTRLIFLRRDVADLIYMRYFSFMLLGFFLGRITMAIQYALFKELAKVKKPKEPV